jgi:hypothetical protein
LGDEYKNLHIQEMKKWESATNKTIEDQEKIIKDNEYEATEEER